MVREKSPAPSGDAARRAAVVEAVRDAGPAVVAVATPEEEVENPFHRSFLRTILANLFEADEPPAAGGPQPLGSGVIVDPNGYVLTNEHVVLRASRLVVLVGPDRRRYPAEVVGTDPASDLAVLRVDGGGRLAGVTSGRSSDLLVGDPVVALGVDAAGGITVTTGLVSALDRSVKVADRTLGGLLRTDAPIPAAASGGALVNVRNELVGVATAVHADARGSGYAVPIDRARKVLEDLLRFGEVRLAWLGVDVRTVRAEAGANGAALPAGAAVRRVYPRSPAESAGLVAGDVIVRLAGLAVGGREEFDAIVSRLKTGESIPVAFNRGGVQRGAVLTAGAFPPAISETWIDDNVGLELSDIPRGLRSQFPALPEDGVIVNRVRARSPAASTGLEEGDVIRQINGLPVRDLEGLRAAVPRVAGRPSLLLKVARGRHAWYVTLDLS